MTFPFSLDAIAFNFKKGDSKKRPFLFVHGNTQNDTCGKGLMRYFESRGHTICSYDLPGHGESLLESSDYSFSDLIKLNKIIIDHYQLESPILCGHSLGSMIQSGTIAQYNLADSSLILCGGLDSNPIHAAKHQGEFELANQIESALTAYLDEGQKLFRRQSKFDYFDNRNLEDLLSQIVNLRNTQPSANRTNLMTLGDFSARKQLQLLKIPLLVLHGEDEEVIPKTIIEGMLANYENARAEWYPKGGHCAFYQQPELTDQFLTKHYDFINAQTVE